MSTITVKEKEDLVSVLNQISDSATLANALHIKLEQVYNEFSTLINSFEVEVDPEPEPEPEPPPDERIVTVHPGRIQSWEVKGRSAEYKLSSVKRTSIPLPQVESLRFENNSAGRGWNQWTIEPLTNQPAGLFQGIATLCHRRDDSYFVRYHYNQSGNTLEEAYKDFTLGNFKPMVFEGPRNFNATTGYTTFQADPQHTGWWGIDKVAGWLFCTRPNGLIWTAAGQETPVENGKIYWPEYKTVGTFDKPWKMITDFRLDPRDKHIVYVCDAGNNRITRTSWVFSNGVLIFSDTRTLVEIPGCRSLDVKKDGTLVIGCRPNKIVEVQTALLNILPDRVEVEVINVSENPLGNQIFNLQELRLNSQEEFVWLENTSKSIYHLTASGNRLVGKITDTPSNAWSWFDIDTTGSIGPIDDILGTVSHTTPGTLRRLGFNDGIVSTAGNGGPLRTGRFNITGVGNVVQDSAQHYGWAIAIHRLSARFIVAGFGDIAHTVFRRIKASDNNAFNLTAWQRGRDVHRFGNETYPAMQSLHGVHGFSYLGLKNFDELAFFSDEELNNYIKSGMEGTLPMVSMTNEQLRNYRYYIRICSIRSLQEKIIY